MHLTRFCLNLIAIFEGGILADAIAGTLVLFGPNNSRIYYFMIDPSNKAIVFFNSNKYNMSISSLNMRKR